jgi:hypothetical protein
MSVLRLVTAFVALFFASWADALINRHGGITPNPADGHWIDTWASMPQLTEPANLPPPPYVCSQTPAFKGEDQANSRP